MNKPFVIRKIAILGAGVMGAQIAAHCVHAGIETFLFDLKSDGSDPNALLKKAVSHLAQLKPSAIATADIPSQIKLRQYEDDLEDLKQCDLIIEAIAERFDLKEALYKKISPYIHQHAILVSNTSGLSINHLKDCLPEALQTRFCGMHFFNPPRYMYLTELIPSSVTSPSLVEHLETWLTTRLGKGVVIAKDTPNFIANRIGVFSLLITLHYAEQFGLGFDEVDLLTGSIIGRPKSATYRTMDVVGLDTMKHVVHTMNEQLKDDLGIGFLPVLLG